MAQEKILAEETPNPNAIRISVGRELIPRDGWLEYSSFSQASNAPLAQRLLNYRFVQRVFIRKEFFTLVRDPNYEWEHIIEDIREAVDRFLDSELPASYDTPSIEISADETESAVIEVLRGSIRNATSGDGGEMIFGGLRDGVLTVVPRGACRDCPFVRETIEGGLQQAFQKHFSGIRKIEWV